MLSTTQHATTPHARPAANNQRPHKQRPPRVPLTVSFKLTHRRLSFTQPLHPSQLMPSLELAPCPQTDVHNMHDMHSAQHAFSELCLRTD